MPVLDESAPIEDHAAVGDGRTVALIDTTGRVDWLPLPGLDALPAFASLIDFESGGHIDLAPEAPYRMTRHYVEGTNVLETVYETDSGRARVTDALVTGIAGRLPWAELDRLVEGLDGEVVLKWRVVAGSGFGTRSPWTVRVDRGHVVRLGDLTLGITTTGRARSSATVAGTVTGSFRTSPKSVDALCITATEGEPLHLANPDRAQAGIRRTVDSWLLWTEEFAYDGPWHGEVLRSALALKLLISSATGAIAAAATTSLPESDDGGKNWDYRYAWIRDLTYTTGALVRFGLREETHAALSWLLTTIKRNGPELQVFYDLNGGVDGHVRKYEAPGWRGIGPVVTGNPAQGQLQLGVYGDLFGIVRSYVREGNVIDSDTKRFLADIADRVADTWHTPDSGMWELTDLRHYTSSKMACWQALDAAVWLAENDQVASDNAERWASEAERIKDWVMAHCWSDERTAYVMFEGSELLDTSVLLHAVSGFDRGPRMSATIDAVRSELGRDDLLYRYSGIEAGSIRSSPAASGPRARWRASDGSTRRPRS